MNHKLPLTMPASRRGAAALPDRRRDAFTRLELSVVIGVLVLVVLFAMPKLRYAGKTARRINCLTNARSLWKAASGWGLEPGRETFPRTNLSAAVAEDNIGLTPYLFICPDAAAAGVNRLGDITPAASLAEVRDHNSNYDFVSGYTDKDGDKVVIADKNGQTNGAPQSHHIAPDNKFEDDRWGGNHIRSSGVPGCGGRWKTDYACGGNIVKVAGQGTWVATTNDAKYAGSVITNEPVRSWFTRGEANTVFGH